MAIEEPRERARNSSILARSSSLAPTGGRLANWGRQSPSGAVPKAVLIERVIGYNLAMADTLSLAAVKDRFSEIVDRVNKQHDRVIVTRNGVPAVVVVSVEELESLEETLEVLSDRDTVAALRESEQQIAEGLDEVITEDNARARWIR